MSIEIEFSGYKALNAELCRLARVMGASATREFFLYAYNHSSGGKHSKRYCFSDGSSLPAKRAVLHVQERIRAEQAKRA